MITIILRHLFSHTDRARALKICYFAILLITPVHGVTLDFQQGLGGYFGTLDVFIRAGAEANENRLGSVVQHSNIDGLAYYEAINQRQLLLRFDDIFGTLPGQIPQGASISSATLTLTTSNAFASDPSNGPHGVAQLLTAFDSSVTWNSLVNGISRVDGEMTRPLGNGFGEGVVNVANSADVTHILRNWSNGQANEGFLVQAGTNDAWRVYTSSAAGSHRPLLSVTFDPSPLPSLLPSTVTLRQGLHGYTSTTVASFSDDGPETLDVTNSGGVWLDNDSVGRNDAALIRFDNMFVSDGGIIPDNATISSATLLLTTSLGDGILDPDTFATSSTPTKSIVNVHQMLQPWDTTTLWDDAFGDLNSPGIGTDVSSVLDTSTNLIAESQTALDVTDAVWDWQSGGANNGFFVQLDSGDGWRLAAPGYGEEDGRPTLLISYLLDSADFEQDEDVDGDDFLTWQRGFGVGATFAEGDANNSGSVDGADLTIWESQFGTTMHPSSFSVFVPEPASFLILLCGITLLIPILKRNPSP